MNNLVGMLKVGYCLYFNQIILWQTTFECTSAKAALQPFSFDDFHKNACLNFLYFIAVAQKWLEQQVKCGQSLIFGQECPFLKTLSHVYVLIFFPRNIFKVNMLDLLLYLYEVTFPIMSVVKKSISMCIYILEFLWGSCQWI